MKLPLLIQTVELSILDEVRARMDSETLTILDSIPIPLRRRIEAHQAEAFLAGIPCSLLTSIAACGAWQALKAPALRRDRLLLCGADMLTLERYGASAIAA